MISGQSFELAQPEPRTSLARGPESFKICSLWLLALPWLDPGTAGYQALISRIAGHRAVTDRNRHRARKSKSPSTFGHAGPKDTVTRIATAVITMASAPG